MPPEQRDKIDESMLSSAADLGMVENIALLSNSRDNGFIGVNMYCDDEASFVDAALNPRASEIAYCCGKQMQVTSILVLSWATMTFKSPARVMTSCDMHEQ